MKIELPELPYAKDALEPYISSETLDYHHGKHHNAYVTKTKELIQGTEFESLELEEIIQRASGVLFNQSAQVWNHTFYWHSLSPNGGGEPSGAIADAIRESFGSFDAFRDEFIKQSTANFGSGWGWLVQNKADKSLAIVQTDDAKTPLTDSGVVPLLTCDVWEHAYYIDYRNARPKYLESYFKIINWDFANQNLQG